MQIVIEIPEEQKQMVDAIMELPPQIENDLISAIRHGTPLPEHHGKIVDLSDLWDAYHDVDYDFYEAIDIVKPIIEATEGTE